MLASFRKRSSANSHKNSPASATRPRTHRPLLECLEDRVVPSAFHVTNLNDTGPGSLRAAITAANANPFSTIDFNAGLTGTINLNSVVTITQAVEIDGPGAGVITLSGRNLNQVFFVDTLSPVTITDLTIANGRASFAGGGIYNDAPLTLSRVTFANNQSSDGGALYNFNGSAMTTINDCIFTNNHVAATPGNFNVFGGAITSFAGTLTVTNTKFTNNYALGLSNASGSSYEGVAEGGAVSCYFELGTDTFSNCTFMGNSARGGSNCTGVGGTNYLGLGQGGAMDVERSSVEVDQCTFTQNYAQGGKGSDTTPGSSGRIGLGLGGAIEVETVPGFGGSAQLTVNDSTFSSNRALGANFGAAQSGTVMNEGVGGAINDEGSDTFLTVAGSTFNRNTAMGGISGFRTGSATNGYFGSDGVGGAINLGLSASGDISAGTTFSYNVALGANGTGDADGGFGLGGAIDTFPTSLTISDTQFLNNRAQGGNGGPTGPATSGVGGGLRAVGGVLNLWDLTFTSNRAIAGNGQGPPDRMGWGVGGAMSLAFTATTADSLNIQGNLAQGATGFNGSNGGPAFGGGIYSSGNTLLTISNSTITQNTAQGGLSFGGTNGASYGGGIVDFNSPGVLSLINTSVNSNVAMFGSDIYPS